MSLLFTSSQNYFLRHPLQLLFSVLGITLGVAIVVGMDLAIYSAKQSFKFSVQSIAGNASHRIVGENSIVPEQVYHRLRTELGLKNITPLINTNLSLPQLQSKKIRLLGIDPLSEGNLQRLDAKELRNLSADTLQLLLSQPNSIVVSESFIVENGLQIGDKLNVKIAERQHELTIVAMFPVASGLKSELKNWFLSDISTAQELLGWYGYISQIDLILSGDNQQLLNTIKRFLPPGVTLMESNQHQRALSQLSDSFELNLTALSLLGIVVAMFLIYNTCMFSVVQRRKIFARMRVIGVSRRELFNLVISEAILIGSIATIIGIMLGFLLAKVLVVFVSQTINDLYYQVQVNRFYWQPLTFYKAIALGIGTTVVAAAFPAWEAAFSQPIRVLQRIEIEQKTWRWINYLAIPGLIGCGVVFFLINQANGSMGQGFFAVFVLIASMAVLMPRIIRWLLIPFAVVMKFIFAMPGKMAVNNIARSLSRANIAIIALTIAVAATLGIGIMIKSFRITVDDWLAGYLRADFFISSSTNSQAISPINPKLLERIVALPGVSAVSSDSRRTFFFNNQYHQLLILDIPRKSFRAFRLKHGNAKEAERAWFEEDAVLISEPYAYRHRLQVGDDVSLPTPLGKRHFKIVGVFYHYGAEQGLINISRGSFERYWQKAEINSIGVYLEDNTQASSIESELDMISSSSGLSLISKVELHRESLRIFDRTFKITQVLKLLVVIVSFIGILSALMAIALERSREFAVLRVLGLNQRELSTLIYLETLVMGVVAAILALPIGTVLAYLLIEVINYRSFGWSMLFILPPMEYLYAALLAILAAVMAAVYPAYTLAKTQPVVSLRGE